MNPYRLLSCLIPCSLAALLLSVSQLAYGEQTRDGTIAVAGRGPDVEGALTSTGLTSADAGNSVETGMAVTLSAALPVGPGQLIFSIDGEAASFGHAIIDTDESSTLDHNGGDSLQLSELFYRLPYKRADFHVGLLNPTRFLDSSEVANDETRQFAGGALVNNPVIALPDYTPGIVYRQNRDSSMPSFVFFAGGSHAPGETPDTPYSHLLNFNRRHPGLFVAAEGYLPWTGWKIRPGVWLNSASHERIDGSGERKNNSGAYLSVDGVLGRSRWNLRLGRADEEVSASSGFAALAVELPVKQAVLGAGVAYTALSNKLKTRNSAGFSEAELYLRLDTLSGISVTPAILRAVNSPECQIECGVGGSSWLGMLRFNYSF